MITPVAFDTFFYSRLIFSLGRDLKHWETRVKKYIFIEMCSSVCGVTFQAMFAGNLTENCFLTEKFINSSNVQKNMLFTF